MAKEGKIRVFCGEGKGKTSAALGYAFKKLGEGEEAFLLQFKRDDKEAGLLKKFEPEVKVFNFDGDTALNFSKKVISSKECDVFILDEVLSILEDDSPKESVIMELMELQKKTGITLVLTGNSITEKIAENSDYITELNKRK